MIIDLWNWTKYNADTETMIMPDWTTFHAPMVKDDTPEWKAMLEWASKYIDILEWK